MTDALEIEDAVPLPPEPTTDVVPVPPTALAPPPPHAVSVTPKRQGRGEFLQTHVLPVLTDRF